MPTSSNRFGLTLQARPRHYSYVEMLYELIGVVRPGRLLEVKEIVTSAGSIILNSGGVVRGITNWGICLLPTVVRKHHSAYRQGHYFLMRFDGSVKAQTSLRKTLDLDPRMVRHSVVKLGSSLKAIRDVAGKAEWKTME